jgi:hypothetical protein
VIALAAPDLPTLADLGYEGEADTVHFPIKKPAHGHLSDDQKTTNLIHAHLRSQAERANSLLKTTFKPYGASVSAPGTSAPSPQPHSYSYTTSTYAPHDLQRVAAGYQEWLTACQGHSTALASTSA